MCGIFGYCSADGELPELELLNRCRDSLRRRGPDMSGAFEDRGVYLGFRRLAILDLSTDANQPMTSVDGRYTIVFNGEIYNFLELRAELEREGHLFRTHSDTEVLLGLYARSGTRGLEKLNGMFAFAVYDRVERTILLVRDRLGVKPLYYWRQGRTLAFASEMRALRELPGFPGELDPEALGLYFCGGAVPEWTSVYAGLSKLYPGCWVRYEIDTGRVDGPVAYWDLPQPGEHEGRSEEQWLDEIEALLWDATRIRLRSDVPLGVFLSGGIDSGLVAAAAARQVRGLSSLTIGYAGEPEDETSLALATARHLGLNPITRNLEVQEGMRALPQIMGYFDEPFADASALPTSLICEAARRDFTVVLSGDAGDEVFGGYTHYLRAWQCRWINSVPDWLRRPAGSLLARFAGADSTSKRFFRRLGHPAGLSGFGGPVYPYHDWVRSCLKPEFVVSPERLLELYQQHNPSWVGASTIDLAQRIDMRNYLLEDILTKVDRMSMMHSLEVRSPFLDYRMVELGLRIPSRLRVKNGENKYLLRKLAARHLPQAVCRAPKQGFVIPFRAWLNEAGPALMPVLRETHNGCPDPFVEGGAEKVWRLAQSKPLLMKALVFVLAYRWWCDARTIPSTVAAGVMA